jgi:hypothetical protein
MLKFIYLLGITVHFLPLSKHNMLIGNEMGKRSLCVVRVIVVPYLNFLNALLWTQVLGFIPGWQHHNDICSRESDTGGDFSPSAWISPANRHSVHHHPIGLTIQRVVTFSTLGCWLHLSDLLVECVQNVFCSENYTKHINKIKLLVKIKKCLMP